VGSKTCVSSIRLGVSIRRRCAARRRGPATDTSSQYADRHGDEESHLPSTARKCGPGLLTACDQTNQRGHDEQHEHPPGPRCARPASESTVIQSRLTFARSRAGDGDERRNLQHGRPAKQDPEQEEGVAKQAERQAGAPRFANDWRQRRAAHRRVAGRTIDAVRGDRLADRLRGGRGERRRAAGSVGWRRESGWAVRGVSSSCRSGLPYRSVKRPRLPCSVVDLAEQAAERVLVDTPDPTWRRRSAATRTGGRTPGIEDRARTTRDRRRRR